MAILKIQHGCKPHPFQDKRYGADKRVMNECKDKGFRCTVCGTKQS